MQIEIYNPTQAQALPAVEWNFEAVKKWLEDGLTAYKGVVYDDTQITVAKKDAAALRKLKTAIDDKRKEMKSRYLAPYSEFEAQAKVLTGMIDTQVSEIAAQITAYENFRKQEKQKTITDMWNSAAGELAALIPYERIHNQKWLNVTCSLSNIETEITEKVERIKNELDVIGGMSLDAMTMEQVKGTYIETLDLAAAIAKEKEIALRRERLERYESASKTNNINIQNEEKTPTGANKACERAQETRIVDFRVWATDEQLTRLKQFLKNNGIKYGRVID